MKTDRLALALAALALVVALFGLVTSPIQCRPGPVGPPPLVYPDQLQVVVVYESNEQAAPLGALEARDLLTDHEVYIVDVDTITPENETPAELAAAVTAARSHGLPALVITNEQGDTIYLVTDLPDNAEGIVALVQKKTEQE